MYDTPIGRIEHGRILLPAALTAQSLRGVAFTDVSGLPETLEIDFRALKHCDSAGIAALIWLLGQTIARDCRISWHRIGKPLRQLLTLYQLDTRELIVDAEDPH